MNANWRGPPRAQNKHRMPPKPYSPSSPARLSSACSTAGQGLHRHHPGLCCVPDCELGGTCGRRRWTSCCKDAFCVGTSSCACVGAGLAGCAHSGDPCRATRTALTTRHPPPAGLDLPVGHCVRLPLHSGLHLGHPRGHSHPHPAALVAAGQGLRCVDRGMQRRRGCRLCSVAMSHRAAFAARGASRSSGLQPAASRG